MVHKYYRYGTTLFGNIECIYPKAQTHIRVFAIHQIMLGWKTYKYYYETDELLNSRPTQPKEN